MMDTWFLFRSLDGACEAVILVMPRRRGCFDAAESR
jgi:hypothetical protein